MSVHENNRDRNLQTADRSGVATPTTNHRVATHIA